ncbi:MAG: FkbM family methyltransferase [Nitrosomonadales bacterium]|nr:FkbM family methyltransferase [Nitrosomonadales bacterium]
MTIVSYAQNFEDVMLWRALRHVENGVYIDVGAQHPVTDSVSLAFYEHGWRGVHVEPNSHYAQMLRESRPDRTVIQAAVCGKGAVLTFYEIADTGLSTCDPEIAKRHRAAGFAVRETTVPSMTLANVFELCADHEIHWLKIDVEGLEEQVLQGWQPSKARPWIVVVESTLPLTQIESHDQWENLIIDLDYKFIYFDGLNRYYIAKNHPELNDAFLTGPNVFDGFILSGTASTSFCSLLNNRLATYEQALNTKIIQSEAEIQCLMQTLATREHELNAQLAQEQHDHFTSRTRAKWLENEWNAAKAKSDELNHRSYHWKTVADGLNYELQSVYASKSWRITAPLRKIMPAINRVLALPPRQIRWALRLTKRMFKPLALWAIRRTIATPTLKIHALRVLTKHPHLMQHLRQVAMTSGLIAGSNMPSQINQRVYRGSDPKNVAGAYPPDLSEQSIKELPPRVVRIYSDLQKATNVRRSNAHCN